MYVLCMISTYLGRRLFSQELFHPGQQPMNKTLNVNIAIRVNQKNVYFFSFLVIPYHTLYFLGDRKIIWPQLMYKFYHSVTLTY